MLKISLTIIAFCILVNVSAQTYPNMSTKYSTEQAEQMYVTHKREKSWDINRPPLKIEERFKLDFPKARDIEWEECSALYEVDFEIGKWLNKRDYKAYYDKEGELIMYKAETTEDELPGIVKNAALAKYPNFKFDEIEKIVKGNETYYDLELENGKRDVDIRIMHDGSIVNRTFN